MFIVISILFLCHDKIFSTDSNQLAKTSRVSKLMLGPEHRVAIGQLLGFDYYLYNLSKYRIYQDPLKAMK